MRGQIINNKTKSCGHLNHQIKDISGNKYGRLKVINLAYIKDGNSYYNCICDCGTKCIKQRRNLIDGLTRSCGCLSTEVHSQPKTHGMSKSRLYRIWQHIKGRCLNPNNDSYINYGGRGIFICNEWKNSFEKFYEDMGESYNLAVSIHGEYNISINRINNDDGYYKENCEWATSKEQQNNQRGNVNVFINGNCYTLFEVYNNFAIPGLTYSIVRDRYTSKHWDIKDALSIPISNTTYIPERKENINNHGKKYRRDNRAFYFDINFNSENNK